MPKRVCPFEYDLLPQSKVHVSEKEVNMGVLRNSHMKSVYDKTIGMLFKGANAQGTCSAEAHGCIEEKNHSKHSFKQMFLSNDCQLRRDGEVQSVPAEKCSLCQVSCVEMLNKCNFCDRVLCQNCTSQCAGCGEQFCSRCSLTVYAGKEDEKMCFGCCR